MLEQREGYEDSAIGILNVSIEDITLDAADEVKRNILSACNKCSVMGKKHNREYATLLDAKTGNVISGCELKAGDGNSVNITIWTELFEKSAPNALWAIHNHTNGTPFSSGDLEFFTNHPSIDHMFLASGNNIYYMVKETASKPEFVAIERDIRKETTKRAGRLATLELYAEILKAALRKNGIEFGRW